jgi:peptide/nickel transport system substrate-binding protein
MLGEGKLSRRRFLGGALATTAGAVLAGCGGGGDNAETTARPTESAGGEPKRGGTIRQASMGSLLGLDPHMEGLATAASFYSYVVHATDWQGTVGDLGESWEIVDELDWIFKIRPGVRFHDIAPVNGREFVAGDIVKSIKRQTSLPGTAKGWDQWVEKYEAPDPATFFVRTRKPYGYLLYSLGAPGSAIIPIEAVETFGDLRSHVIGSGPFMLKDYQLEQGLSMVRNPGYYHEFPYVEQVDIKVLKDETSVQAAFRAGDIDAYLASNKLKADAVGDVEGVSVQNYLDRVYAVFVLNAAKFEAFKDERVREAVDLALDRKAMIDRIYFGSAELAGPVPPLWDTALPKEEVERAYTRDVEKAKQLLSAAGQEGLKFALSFSSYGDVADLAAIIKSNLAEAGITADLQPGELVTWLASYIGGSFEATTLVHLPYLSDDIQLQSHHSRGFMKNDAAYLGVDDPEVDAMLEKVQEAIDSDEKIRRAQEVQRKILARHGPTLVLYEPYGYWAAYDYIKGYTPTAYGFGMFKYDYWIDKG